MGDASGSNRDDPTHWFGNGKAPEPKRKKHHVKHSTAQSMVATTALTCSPKHLTMTVSCDSLEPWDVSSCSGRIQSLHCQQLECKSGHGNVGTEGADQVRDKWKDGRVDSIGRAQHNLQDHKKREDRPGETLHAE